MARCGCDSTCSCAIQGTGSITVTGMGSAGNPYIVSSSSPAGGLITGYATYSFDFSGSMISSDPTPGFVHPSGVTTINEVGDHGIDTVISDGLIFNGPQGLWVFSAFFTISGTTNVISTDTHVVEYGNFDSRTGIGTYELTCAIDEVFLLPSGGGTYSPGFLIQCSGGTDREYSVDGGVYVQVVRYDIP